MKVFQTPIEGVRYIELQPRKDERGQFVRLYCKHELSEVFQGREIVQTNYSMNLSVGTIRGMHVQGDPAPESKLVTCVSGRVWDVVLDLRSDSRTYLQWHAVELSAQSSGAIFVPKGCAHGFQVLEKNSGLVYHHDEYYHANAQRVFRYDDPIFKIQWPLPLGKISDRDRHAELLKVK